MKMIWDGKGIPPVGCDVYFDTSSSGQQVGTVTGFHIMEALSDNPAYHRIFIDLVYKGTTTPNCRLLYEVKPLLPPELLE